MEKVVVTRNSVYLWTVFTLLVLMLARPVSAQHFGNRFLVSSSAVAEQDAYVIYRTPSGQTTCREATEAEQSVIAKSRTTQLTSLIYAGAPLQSKQSPSSSFIDTSSGLTLQPSAGLRIALNATAQLNQNPQAKNAFIIAANRWEAIISSPITVVLDVDYGPTFFGEPYGDPDILGQTGSEVFIGDYSTVRSRLVSSASGSLEQQLYNALPTDAVPVEFNGTNSNVTSVRLTLANARALGLTANIDPNSIPLGSGDAGIGFNSAFAFDFTPDDGITINQTDFDSVATHEIGHALGFASRSGGSTPTPVGLMDLFRVAPSDAMLNSFTNGQRLMSKGGTQVFFDNRISTFGSTSLGLSTGGLDPGPGDEDGRQSSHWKDDELDSRVPYIGVMDPTISEGLRRTISENDIAAIDTFGYSIGLPAPIRPPNDNAANAIALTGISGSITGTNVNATREQGEALHAGFLSDKSVWYVWTSPVTGQATFDTLGSNFDTTLWVSNGAFIVENDDLNSSERTSRVQLNVTQGNTYSIVVDSWNGEYGNIVLNWNSVAGPPPTPTPTPTPAQSADLVMESLTIPVNPVMRTQTLAINFSARNDGPIAAAPAQVKVVLPSSTSFINCSPFCESNGQEVTFTVSKIDPGFSTSGVVFANVTSPVGSILPVSALVSSATSDPNPVNNSAITSFTVSELVPFSEVTALSTQSATVLALRRGTVWAWGSNSYGQIGDGTRTPRGIPVQVDDLYPVKAIAAGLSTSYAVKQDGTLWSWGNNPGGELGIGTALIADSLVPIKVSGLDSVSAIAAGQTFALALKADGTVWSWGRSSGGALGLGTTTLDPHPSPTKISGLSGIVRIFAGDDTAFAIRNDGTVFGWGNNSSGQIGTGGASQPVSLPVEVPGMKNAKSISTGDGATTLIKQDNSVWVCGSDLRGRLGLGLFTESLIATPTQISNLAAVMSSTGSHTLVLLADGTVKSFGSNQSGQLGFGTIDPLIHPTPTSIQGITNVFSVESLGGSFSGTSFLMIGDSVNGGIVKAWGANFEGILGNGSFGVTQSTPNEIGENLVVAKPLFSVKPGLVNANTSVKIVSGTPGSVVHYTTNGQEPTLSDPIATNPFVVTQTVTVKAKAWRTGFTPSSTVTGEYFVSAAPNPIDDARVFARQQYLDFLGREPDPSGWDFWTNEITSCGTNQSCIEVKRINVSGAFFLSVEFQQTGYLVERVHKAAYGDKDGSTLGGAQMFKVPVISRADLVVDQGFVGQGVIVGQPGWELKLAQNTQLFYESFVTRAKFRTAFPPFAMSGADFVDKLNTNAGSPLSQAERNTLIAGYQNNDASRVQVLRAIVEHPNFVNAEYNRAFVLMQYFGYLQRNPFDAPDSDYGGYEFWLNKLNQFNGNFVNAEMVKAFIISTEYRNRFMH
jgi:alpha-tubulin suppressor-like RCC1 family protein